MFSHNILPLHLFGECIMFICVNSRSNNKLYSFNSINIIADKWGAKANLEYIIGSLEIDLGIK